ncbi:MAG: response regulator transcription factor [Dichotomicrobium sp.]
MPSRETTCLIMHDPEERRVLNRILSRAGYRVSEYDEGSAFLADLPDVQASCAIVDVRLPDVDAVAFIAEASRNCPDIAFVIATSSADVPYAMHAMNNGAVDFIEKPVDGEILLQLLHDAMDSLSPRASELPDRNRPGRIDRLTPRERDVLGLLVQGYRNKLIAYELGISERTVEVYRASVMRRLNAGSLAELVRIAIEDGLYQTPGMAPPPSNL